MKWLYSMLKVSDHMTFEFEGDELVEFSHNKLMSKIQNPARGHAVEKHHPEATYRYCTVLCCTGSVVSKVRSRSYLPPPWVAVFTRVPTRVSDTAWTMFISKL